jgi:GDP-D-mannose dehydratase
MGRESKREDRSSFAREILRMSEKVSIYTADVDATDTLRILEAIKSVGIKPRFYSDSPR